MLRAHRVPIFQTSTRAAWVCTVWPHMVTKGMLGYGCSLLTKGVSHRWQITSHPNMVAFDLKACWQQLADHVWDLNPPPKKHNPKTKPVGDDIVSNTHHLFTVYNLDTFCSIITLLLFFYIGTIWTLANYICQPRSLLSLQLSRAGDYLSLHPVTLPWAWGWAGVDMWFHLYRWQVCLAGRK